ncbi:MAG TPA: hypothetical protein VEA37_05315, partial [Flavobacterium sp.]|nr:hypothetical protein [Flavobacterium sp.]
ENRYEAVHLDDDFRHSTFESILINGTTVKLGIKISTTEHPFMPNVYNLGFGPLDGHFRIDDKARLTHQDHSKVFSTIVFTAHSFLKANEGKYLGFDGSNTARAYMYYRCIQNNYDYLNSIFNIYGIYYFLRVFRDGSDRNEPKDLFLAPDLLLPGKIIPAHKLYNYFIFNNKPGR